MRTAIAVAVMCSACAGTRLAGTCDAFPQIDRELARVDRGPPLVGAQILETAAERLYEHGERAADCDEDLADALYEQTFGKAPVVASRMLVARIQAIARLPSIVGVIDRKARFLVRIARLSDRELAEYRAEPGETVRRSRAWIRSLAVRAIARSSLPYNVAAAHALLVDELRATHDDRERIALGLALDTAFDAADQPAVDAFVRGSVDDLERRLASPPDPWSLEVALLEIRLLGAFGPRAGATDAIPLLDNVIGKADAIPLARGVPGAADDLLVAAATARVLFGEGGVAAGYAPPEPVLVLRPPPPDDPADVVPPADAVARVRDLDAEIDPPCAAIHALAHALPARRFDAFVAPVLPDARLWVSDDALCRLRAALEMEQVGDDPRRAVVRRVFERAQASFSTGNTRARYASYAAAIGDALAAHPAWIEADPAVRAWLAGDATELLDLTGRSHDIDDLSDSLAMSRGLLRAIALAIAHDPDTMRRAVSAWSTALARLPDDFYNAPETWFEARVLMVALWAPRVGLDAEARRLFAALRAPSPRPAHDWITARLQRLAATAEIVRAATARRGGGR